MTAAVPYALSPEQLASITDIEVAFTTDRLLPPWDQIPTEFRRGNLYTRLVSALFYGQPLPDAEMVMHDGFDTERLNRAVRAQA